MKVDVKVEMKVERTYTLKLNKEEFELLFSGIGNTSVASRTGAGMTVEEARFFTDFYNQLKEA